MWKTLLKFNIKAVILLSRYENVLEAHVVIKRGLLAPISVCAHLLRLLICSFEDQILDGYSVLSSLEVSKRRATVSVSEWITRYTTYIQYQKV